MSTFGDAIILGEWPSGSPEWLAARKIGGSTIGTLAAWHRWHEDPIRYAPPRKGPWTIYHEMMDSTPGQRRYVFERGHQMEPLLLEWAGILLGEDVRPYKASLRHKHHAWATFNADGVIYRDWAPVGFVEAKDFARERASEFAKGPPDMIVDQVCWGQGITGIHGDSWIVVSFGGAEPKLYRVPWDPDRFELLLRVGETFWRDHIEAGVEPEPDHTRECAEAMGTWTDEDAEPAAEMDADTAHWARQYIEAGKAEKSAKARKDEARNQLMGRLGDVRRLEGPGLRVSRVQGRKRLDFAALAMDHASTVDEYRTAFDEKRFAKAHPELVEAYKTTVTAGYVRVTETAEDDDQ